MRAIARDTWLRQLTDLTIASSSGSAFGPAAVRALVRSRGLRRVPDAPLGNHVARLRAAYGDALRLNPDDP